MRGGSRLRMLHHDLRNNHRQGYTTANGILLSHTLPRTVHLLHLHVDRYDPKKYLSLNAGEDLLSCRHLQVESCDTSELWLTIERLLHYTNANVPVLSYIPYLATLGILNLAHL